MDGEFYRGIILKKVSLKQQGLSPNFIGSWIIDPLSTCDELISYFESNRGKQTSGVVGGGGKIWIAKIASILK